MDATYCRGRKIFCRGVKDKIRFRAIGSKVINAGGFYELKESEAPNSSNFDSEMITLTSKKQL